MSNDSSWWQEAAGAAEEVYHLMDSLTISTVDELLEKIDYNDTQQRDARIRAQHRAEDAIALIRQRVGKILHATQLLSDLTQ